MGQTVPNTILANVYSMMFAKLPAPNLQRVLSVLLKRSKLSFDLIQPFKTYEHLSYTMTISDRLQFLEINPAPGMGTSVINPHLAFIKNIPAPLFNKIPQEAPDNRYLVASLSGFYGALDHSSSDSELKNNLRVYAAKQVTRSQNYHVAPAPSVEDNADDPVKVFWFTAFVFIVLVSVEHAIPYWSKIYSGLNVYGSLRAACDLFIFLQRAFFQKSRSLALGLLNSRSKGITGDDTFPGGLLPRQRDDG